ncbi:MAG: DUF2167 domain-containing protein [Novosphingobium sp.]
MLELVRRIVRPLAFAGALLFVGSLASAQPTDANRAELDAAWQAAGKAAIDGPRDVPVADQASLELPAGTVFVPSAEANRLMAAMGNSVSPTRIGLIVPTAKGQDWFVDVEWIDEGYVKDGDAKEWEPDTMLEGMREGTAEQNTERVAKGIPAMQIVGWIEPPTYDGQGHKLVWSLAARDEGAAANQPQTVNYNTFALGRNGYVSLGLVTSSTAIASDKAVVHSLLASLEFKGGKRYEDFNESTDKVAAYGLAGLVGAVAIKKMGLFAALGVLLLKVWKLLLVAVIAGWAAIKRFFGKGEAEDSYACEDGEEAVEPSAPAPAPDTPPPLAE